MLRSICTYEAHADTDGTGALGVEVDCGTDLLEIKTGSKSKGVGVWGFSTNSICGAANLSATGALFAISRGGRDSGELLSVYTNCSSTVLVIFNCAFSGESITTVVPATADANATRLIKLDTGGAKDLQRQDLRLLNTEPDV